MYRNLLLASRLMLIMLGMMFLSPVLQVEAQGTGNVVRRVNAPYFPGEGGMPAVRKAIFWFGHVTPTANNVDVRVGYNDERLEVTLHIFDKYLWYDSSPSSGDGAAWDSATLYVNVGDSVGTAPTSQSYRFRGQLRHFQDPSSYEWAYRGNGTVWQQLAIPFGTETGWRGNGLNGPEGRGWTITYAIPFSSLGLNGPPERGTLWRLGLTVHDRDDLAGTGIADQLWPESASDLQPQTWGQLRFGIPEYDPPLATGGGWITVRQGLNGAVVPDAHVGGDTDCGQRFGPDYFSGWGSANYYNDPLNQKPNEEINIQNQWDVADWPCFSRYFVTFPLDAIPAGKIISAATLTLHQFGNSQPADAQTSYIQVLSVGEDWREATITWNNAPLAVENVASQWVEALPGFPGWPGVPRTWDVARAVDQALSAGEPLRLVLYSADAAIHSGKYFSSSDVEAWNAAARPTLRVLWGDRYTGEVQHGYLPVIVGQ